MKTSSGKPKIEESPTGNVTKTNTNSKVFAATTTSTRNTIATKPSTQKFQVSCVVCKKNIRCDVVKCSERRLQRNERKFLARTNFVSHALMDNTLSAIAYCHANAPKMAVEVRTTLCYMVQRRLSQERLTLGKRAMVKQLLVA